MNLTGKSVCPKPTPVKADHAHLSRVRGLPCAACGRSGPNEAHHCRDLPDYAERDIYQRIPGAAMKSGDHDAIPLCQEDHWMFHNRRAEFHALYGKDYRHITTTREAISPLEIDF